MLKRRQHMQFFTRDSNAISRNYFIAVARKNLFVQHILPWQRNI